MYSLPLESNAPYRPNLVQVCLPNDTSCYMDPYRGVPRIVLGRGEARSAKQANKPNKRASYFSLGLSVSLGVGGGAMPPPPPRIRPCHRVFYTDFLINLGHRVFQSYQYIYGDQRGEPDGHCSVQTTSAGS